MMSLLSPGRHFASDRGLVGRGQHLSGDRKYIFILDEDVVFIDIDQCKNGLPEAPRLFRGKNTSLQTRAAQPVDFRM